MQSIFTKVNNLMMHARVIDNLAPAHSPIVVLVHGLGMSSRYMIPTAERLADCARVYAPDLPGFGLSEKPPHALSIAELSDYLLAWMDVLKLERATFVGNSFGAQVIVDFIVRYPQRVERAALIALTIDPHARTAFRQIARLILDATREPVSLFPLAISDYFKAGFFRAARTLRFALADHIEEKLQRVNTPTLIIRGERDPIVPQRWAEESTRLLPGARLEVIPQAAHAVNYNSPAELARVLTPFLHGKS